MTRTNTPEGFLGSDGTYAYYEPKSCDKARDDAKAKAAAAPVNITKDTTYKSESERRLMIGIPKYLYDMSVVELDFSEGGLIDKLPGKFPHAQQQPLSHSRADVLLLNKQLVGVTTPIGKKPDPMEDPGKLFKLLAEVEKVDDLYSDPAAMTDTHDHLEIQRKIVAAPVIKFLDALAVYAKFIFYLYSTLTPESMRSEDGESLKYEVSLYHKDLALDLLFQVKELKEQFKKDKLYYWHGPKRQIRMVLVTLRDGVEAAAENMLGEGKGPKENKSGKSLLVQPAGWTEYIKMNPRMPAHAYDYHLVRDDLMSDPQKYGRKYTNVVFTLKDILPDSKTRISDEKELLRPFTTLIVNPSKKDSLSSPMELLAKSDPADDATVIKKDFFDVVLLPKSWFLHGGSLSGKGSVTAAQKKNQAAIEGLMQLLFARGDVKTIFGIDFSNAKKNECVDIADLDFVLREVRRHLVAYIKANPFPADDAPAEAFQKMDPINMRVMSVTGSGASASLSALENQLSQEEVLVKHKMSLVSAIMVTHDAQAACSEAIFERALFYGMSVIVSPGDGAGAALAPSTAGPMGFVQHVRHAEWDDVELKPIHHLLYQSAEALVDLDHKIAGGDRETFGARQENPLAQYKKKSPKGYSIDNRNMMSIPVPFDRLHYAEIQNDGTPGKKGHVIETEGGFPTINEQHLGESLLKLRTQFRNNDDLIYIEDVFDDATFKKIKKESEYLWQNSDREMQPNCILNGPDRMGGFVLDWKDRKNTLYELIYGNIGLMHFVSQIYGIRMWPSDFPIELREYGPNSSGMQCHKDFLLYADDQVDAEFAFTIGNDSPNHEVSYYDVAGKLHAVKPKPNSMIMVRPNASVHCAGSIDRGTSRQMLKWVYVGSYRRDHNFEQYVEETCPVGHKGHKSAELLNQKRLDMLYSAGKK